MASETQILSREMAHAYLIGTTIPNPLSSPVYRRIIPPIMQNKANFRKSQMNVSFFCKKDYENKRDWTLGENEPKQTQFFSEGSIWS
jgi:hypothetical protein